MSASVRSVPGHRALAASLFSSGLDGVRFLGAYLLTLTPLVGLLFVPGFLARTAHHLASGRRGLPPMNVVGHLNATARAGVSFGIASALGVGPMVGFSAVYAGLVGVLHGLAPETSGALQTGQLAGSVSGMAMQLAFVGVDAILQAIVYLPVAVLFAEALRGAGRGSWTPFGALKQSVQALPAHPEALTGYCRVLALLIALQALASAVLPFNLKAGLALHMLLLAPNMLLMVVAIARWDRTLQHAAQPAPGSVSLAAK